MINDLYALTKPEAEELFPDGVHPNGKGERILAKAVTSTIRVQLLEAQSVRESGRFLISNIGSERATQGNGNKIVTLGDKTHIVWQDSIDEGYFARVRTLHRKTESGEGFYPARPG